MSDTTPAMIGVRRQGDTLRIGSATAGLFASALDLPGGVLIIDARDTGAAPAAIVDDARAAHAWVVRVYGEEIARAIESAGDGEADTATDEDDFSPDDFAYLPTQDGETLERLAFGQWLWRFWPFEHDVSPIDADLLRLELAALAWQADACFGAVQPAGVLLRGRIDVLGEALDAIASDGDASSPLANAILHAADALLVGEAAIAAEVTQPELEGLDERATAIARSAGPESRAAATSNLATWASSRAEALQRAAAAAVGRSQVDLAASASRSPQAPRAHLASVDWLQLPPRVLDWDDATVSWRIDALESDSGGSTLTVSVTAVAAEPGREADPVLFARGYRPDDASTGGLPVIVIPLHRDGVAFFGSARYPGATDGLVVDVYASDSIIRPVISTSDRSAAAAQRDKARDVIRNRDAGVRVPVDGPARRFAAEAAST